MPIRFISGGLFENEHEALAHGCNCQGSMGAGVAKSFRARYPQMFEEYRGRCKAVPRQFNLGDCWLWVEDSRPSVFNLWTQEGFWRARASYEAIEAALGEMRRQADAGGITSIAIPRIGVGYGGLSWKKVRAIVETVFGDWPGTLVVYEDFVPSEVDQAAGQAHARTSPAAAVSETTPSGSATGANSRAIFESDRPERGTMR